ncbi:hypothetical protein MUP51_05905 [Candidatus Bathyarchaeota archaeon]|nr:hypothetical protein [Candidatus Bathyarchaeota archaeon]
MNPKKKLPDGSEEIAQLDKYLLIKSTLDKEAYYSVYEFYESKDGRRYYPRGAGNRNLDAVKLELERITGRKIKATQ